MPSIPVTDIPSQSLVSQLPKLTIPLTGNEFVPVNISGRDAITTTQTIANLGGGSGGGSSVLLLADTNIAAGTAVSLNSSGHVVQTWGPAPQFGGASAVLANASPTNSILQLDVNHFVVITPGVGAVACTQDSSSNVTFGSQNTNIAFQNIAFISTTQGSQSISVTKVDATHFAIVYQNAGFTQSLIAICTVSSNSISVGTGTQIGSGVSIGSTTIAMLTPTLGVICYEDVNVGNAFVAAFSLSGVSVTLGTPVLLMAAIPGAGPNQVYSLSATTFLAIYLDASGGTIDAVVGTVSTLTISLGTPAVSALVPLSTNYTTCFLSSSLFVVSATGANAIVAGSISGTTITFGSVSSVLGQHGALAALDATHLIIGSQGTSLFTTPKIFSISALAFTFIGGGSSSLYSTYGDIVVFSSTLFGFVGIDKNNQVFPVFEGDNNGNVSPPVTNVGIKAYLMALLSSSAAAAISVDQFNNITSEIVLSEPITPSGPIGFAASAITSGQSGTIAFAGSVSGFSGLAPGTTYYVNGDGTLTTANTGHLAGVALSATTLLIA